METLGEPRPQGGIKDPIPAWHEKVLLERTRLIESGAAKWLTLEQLEAFLRK